MDSLIAIKSFEEIINYTKESTIITLIVRADSSEGTIYSETTDCRFYYEAGYMQQVVEINWKIDDNAMKSLGLHSRYTTNFQVFELEQRALIIQAGDITITITEEN